MKDELISIIIPVYNTPIPLFKRCMDSIYSQTYPNLEIIIIDDGSKEKYIETLKKEKIIKKEYNIVFIEKTNTGVSDTRNVGIEKASGKYIMFIDSDDYIGETYILDMYNALKNNNVDISISGDTIVDEDGNEIGKEICKVNYNTKLQINDIVQDMIIYPYFRAAKMLIKKDIINSNFKRNIKYGEDLLFSFELISLNSFVYLNNCDYYYVQNSSSVTNNYSYEYIHKYLKDNLEVFNYIKKNTKAMNDIIDIRLFTKFEIALDRYIKNDECNYKLFKKIYNEYINKYSCKKINIKNLYYLNFYNCIKTYILYKKNLKIYYLLSKIKKYLKRK